MKIGKKVSISIRRFPERIYTITYIGPYTVKLMDEDGTIYTLKKSKVSYRLYGPRK